MVSSRHRALRFGIMCHGTTFPEWEARCIEQLIDAGHVPALLVLDRTPSTPHTIKQKIARGNLLYRAYGRFWVGRRLRSVTPVDLSGVLTDAARIECIPKMKGRFSQYFHDHDIEQIRSHDLDFMIRFAFKIIRGDVLSAARYGVWSYHHGDERKYRGSPACFWEISNNESHVGAILQRLTDKLDGGIVLRRGFFPVGKSYPESIDTVFRGSSDWCAEVCHDILTGQDAALHAPASSTQAKIYLTPTNRQTLTFLARSLGSRAASWLPVRV